MKKLFLSLMLFVLLAPLVEANNAGRQDAINVDGQLQILRCREKGPFDLALFWDAMIYSDNLTDGVVEPFKDILSRNQCQTMDLIVLLNQQDQIRAQIRDVTFRCETEELPRLRKAYNRMRAEIFYVRNVVDGGFALSLPYGALEGEVFGTAARANRDELYTEMYGKYVNREFFTAEEFNIFFVTLESKYSDRVADYMTCPNTSWQEVAQKWEEFQKHFGEEYGGLKEAGAGIAAQSNEFADAVENTNLVRLLSDDDTLVDFAGSFVEANVNGVSPAQGVEEIIDYLNETANLEAYVPPSRLAAIQGLAVDRAGFDKRKMEAEISAEFRAIYRNSGETVEIFMGNLDGRESAETGLLEIMDASYPILADIERQAATMNRRQCN